MSQLVNPACTYADMVHRTFKRKSDAEKYGDWNTFLFFFPFVKFDTFKLSKNLSNIEINRAVSLALSSVVISKALETDSLSTCKTKHTYAMRIFLYLRTNVLSYLCCQINAHLREACEINVLILQFWYQCQSRCLFPSTTIAEVK